MRVRGKDWWNLSLAQSRCMTIGAIVIIAVIIIVVVIERGAGDDGV